MGNYFTSLDMMGATLTLMKLDEELKELLDMPVNTVGLKQKGKGEGMKAFHNKDGKPVLMRMVSGIKENKDYLGEIDGLIGDGDHGMNMNKGFSLFQQRFEKETFDLE